jgi:AcrR family transcriptional regulator
MPPRRTSAAAPAPRPRRRADAERNVARILDAAIDSLSDDPDASMAEIARRAGVVRATLYAHYPTREALLDAVTDRALAEAAGAIDEAEPERGDPAEAITRVVAATWRTLGRYHALVDINTARHTHHELHARHDPVLGRLGPLIERGQRDGTFRSDVPAAWHLAMLLALVHAASGELRAGRVADQDAEGPLVATVLGALAGDRSAG